MTDRQRRESGPRMSDIERMVDQVVDQGKKKPMKVINLYGGPCSGKSTLAGDLFARLKRDGFKVELSLEQAKELLFQERTLSDIQMLITALQYQSLKDRERAGTDIVVTDGPLLHGLVYAQGLPYEMPFKRLLVQLSAEFENFDVFVHRNSTLGFSGHSRVQQDEATASKLDDEIDRWVKNCSRRVATFDYTPGNSEEPGLYQKLKELL